MRNLHGFSLIELMIVVAVVAILATVAYPSYSEFMVRSHRSATQSFMLDLSAREQRFLLDARRYATLAELGVAVPAEVDDHYDVTAVPNNAIAPPTFLVTATPTGAQLSRDTKCGVLTLDQAGTKTESGTGTVADCWGGR